MEGAERPEPLEFGRHRHVTVRRAGGSFGAMASGLALSGRVALVTGASRGIGAAIAERLGSEGAAVAISARTVLDGDHALPGGLDTTARAIRAAGGRVIMVPGDLSRPDDRQRVVADVRDELGPIDILVNNAAITYFAPVADFDPLRADLMFEVQVIAPMHLSQMVLPAMKAARAGWILNISSGAAVHPVGPPYRPAGGGTVYGMCKAALERFTTGLASEVYSDGIAVNSLAPSGLVVTPGVVHHKLDERVPAERHEPVAVMAEAAFRLCSADPKEVTGNVVYSQDHLSK